MQKKDYSNQPSIEHPVGLLYSREKGLVNIQLHRLKGEAVKNRKGDPDTWK
jgi:hypothetical protein